MKLHHPQRHSANLRKPHQDARDNKSVHPSRVGCRKLKSRSLTRLGDLRRSVATRTSLAHQQWQFYSMTQGELWKRWQVTKSHLRFATQLLPKLLTENNGRDSTKEIATLEAYNEYLDHNELELALDQLEGLGELNTVPPAYWKNLANAAETMDLHDRATQLLDQFRLAFAHPATEQTDATEPSDAPKSPVGREFES
jgi:hypothetical protein